MRSPLSGGCRAETRCYDAQRLRSPGGRASVTETAEPTTAAQSWRLDADTGSMVPRSALDVLVDLNDKVTSGRVGEYQPVPLGFTPMDKTIGSGLRAGELLLI